MLKTILRAVALAASVLAATPTLASELAADMRVWHGDLDLSQSADVERLDRRLTRAIKSACPSADGTRDISLIQVAADCRAAKRAEIAPARQAAIARARGAATTFATAR